MTTILFGMPQILLAAVFLVFAAGPLGLPVSVPPLPPDPLMERSAPQECLLHVATRGTAEPAEGSANLTERLLANEEVRGFVGKLSGELLAAVKNSPAVEGPAKEFVDRAILLLGTLASQPVSLTVSNVSIDPAAGPPAVEAAFVVKCGDRTEAVKAAVDGLLEMAFAGAPEAMRPKPVTIGNRDWSRVELPFGGPVTWGFGGSYLIVTVGDEAMESLLERLADKTAKAPAWKRELEERMPRERLSTLAYVDARAVLRIIGDLAKLGGPSIPEGLLAATGLSKLETIGSVTGLSDEGFVASLWVGFDGEPTGIFAAPDGGIDRASLATVPRSAVMAQVVRLDLAKSVVAALDFLEKMDPAEGGGVREQFGRIGQAIGLDTTKDLLEPLGSDWGFFIAPGGGIIPAMAFQVSLDDRARFEKSHERVLGMAVAAAGGAGISVRTFDYKGRTVHCLKAGGAAPLPVTPTWCLAKDRLIVTASPQLMKTLLSRSPEDEGIDAVPQVKRATAAGDEAVVGYLEPTALMATIFSLYEMASPLAEAGLAQQRITLRMPELPSASAVMPHVRPSVTVVRRVQGPRGGILVESTSTLPLGPLSSGGGLIGGAPMSTPILVGLLLPAVQSAREAARRAEAMNNFRMIMISMLNHEAATQRLPAPAICDKDGKPLLSWRVAMLPYLEEQALYEQFRLDEPWDSEHNRKLIPLLPQVYQDPGRPEGIAGGLTTYQMLRGDKTAFPKDSVGPRIGAITDGTSKTIAVVEVSHTKAVPWTKPEDLAFDAKKPLDGLATDRRPGGLFVAGFLDGHVETLSPEVPPEAIRAMVTADAGDAVGE